MKNKKKPLIIVFSCVAVLAVFAVCFWFFWLKDYLAAANATPAYVNSVASITGMNTGAVPRYSGIVEPQKVTKVEKDESKTVAQVLVVEGQEVHIGDPLFAYDTEEMQLSLKQAELELEGIANQITTLQNQKSTLEAEKKKASQDEQYSYTVEIQSIELQIKNAEYDSSVKKSEIDKLKDSLENSQFLSEADGVIQEINLTPKTDATGQQLPFISILSSGEFRIKGTVSELNINALYEGQPVVVHSRISEETWPGTVESIDREPTQGQNNNTYYYGMDSGEQSSKYNFYVLLNNLDGLMLGQHVYIEPDTGDNTAKTGLWLPASYVAHDDFGSFVWARDEQEKLEKRMITLGEYDSENDMYEITSGLSTLDYLAYPSNSLIEGGPTTLDASLQFGEDEIPDSGDGLAALPEGFDSLEDSGEGLPDPPVDDSGMEGLEENLPAGDTYDDPGAIAEPAPGDAAA